MSTNRSAIFSFFPGDGRVSRGEMTHRERLVAGSFITMVSLISPYFSKYDRRVSATKKTVERLRKTKDQEQIHNWVVRSQRKTRPPRGLPLQLSLFFALQFYQAMNVMSAVPLVICSSAYKTPNVNYCFMDTSTRARKLSRKTIAHSMQSVKIYMEQLTCIHTKDNVQL